MSFFLLLLLYGLLLAMLMWKCVPWALGSSCSQKHETTSPAASSLGIMSLRTRTARCPRGTFPQSKSRLKSVIVPKSGMCYAACVRCNAGAPRTPLSLSAICPFFVALAPPCMFPCWLLAVPKKINLNHLTPTLHPHHQPSP